MDFDGRSIIVTGAGSGIGRELALQLAGERARLTLVGRRRDPLEEVADLVRVLGGEAEVVSADLARAGVPEHVASAAAERFGGIDVVINNAGNVRAGRVEAIGEDEIRAQIDLNLTAPILLTRAALGALRASEAGQVVLISSAIGLVALPFYATYAATKAGLAHFGESLRRELAGEGVSVLTVFPGATSTPMMQSSDAGPEHGFAYERPDEVAAATLEAMRARRATLVRGGEERMEMVRANRESPEQVDEMLAGNKDALEEAVAGHASL